MRGVGDGDWVKSHRQQTERMHRQGFRVLVNEQDHGTIRVHGASSQS